eukprot:gb/GECH01011556.1/.p1 GENE.gb/GECH01011556.1/~~gb/GECH01011556.1/.p1  ORF type:complete len:271 (+),score=49.75 gb/GECH01011556.1/:1-813(+)
MVTTNYFKILSLLALAIPYALASSPSSMLMYHGAESVGNRGLKPGLSGMLATHDVFEMPKGFLYMSLPADPDNIKNVNGLNMLNRGVSTVHLPHEHVFAELSNIMDTITQPLPEANNMNNDIHDLLELPKEELHADLKPLVSQLRAAHQALSERAHVSLHLDSLADIHRQHGAKSQVYHKALRLADRFADHAVRKMHERHGNAAHTQVVMSKPAVEADDSPKEFVPSYQLCLWTAIVLVAGIFFGAYVTGTIEYQNDPLVFMSGSAQDLE